MRSIKTYQFHHQRIDRHQNVSPKKYYHLLKEDNYRSLHWAQWMRNWTFLIFLAYFLHTCFRHTVCVASRENAFSILSVQWLPLQSGTVKEPKYGSTTNWRTFPLCCAEVMWPKSLHNHWLLHVMSCTLLHWRENQVVLIDTYTFSINISSFYTI